MSRHTRKTGAVLSAAAMALAVMLPSTALANPCEDAYKSFAICKDNQVNDQAIGQESDQDNKALTLAGQSQDMTGKNRADVDSDIELKNAASIDQETGDAKAFGAESEVKVFGIQKSDASADDNTITAYGDKGSQDKNDANDNYIKQYGDANGSGGTSVAVGVALNLGSGNAKDNADGGKGDDTNTQSGHADAAALVSSDKSANGLAQGHSAAVGTFRGGNSVSAAAIGGVAVNEIHVANEVNGTANATSGSNKNSGDAKATLDAENAKLASKPSVDQSQSQKLKGLNAAVTLQKNDSDQKQKAAQSGVNVDGKKNDALSNAGANNKNKN